MQIVIDWSFNDNGVPVCHAAKLTGVTQTFAKEMYRRGEIGPAPDVGMQVSKIPLLHLAGLFALQEANTKGIAPKEIFGAMESVAAAIYIRFAMSELAAGRCIPVGGTNDLNIRLWAALKSPNGQKMLEERLPTPGMQTMRFACYKQGSVTLCDELDGSEGDQVIDAWAVASQMQKRLPGTHFFTRIK